MVEIDACKMKDMCCATPDADGIRGLAKGLTKHPLSLKRRVYSPECLEVQRRHTFIR